MKTTPVSFVVDVVIASVKVNCHRYHLLEWKGNKDERGGSSRRKIAAAV
jgi:hypothetical protein